MRLDVAGSPLRAALDTLAPDLRTDDDRGMVGAMTSLDVLEGLDEEQARAVLAPTAPVLVVAGAGSGKTRVLTHRIGYLVGELGHPPSSILAITFTNKAAGEMLQRVERLLGARLVGRMWVRTFHSACARILREHAPSLGIATNFTIYDEDDSAALLRTCLKEAGLDPKRVSPAWLGHQISLAKNELKQPDTHLASLDVPYADELARVAEEYERRLRSANAVDFDDLLVLTVRLLTEHPAVLDSLQDRFEHILVDEFQDTNRAQLEIVRLLGASKRSVFCVGDQDQSIYAFRGADYRNLDRFLASFPDALVLKLERNYRSTQVILDAANAVISKNPSRVPKRLWTTRKGGPKIVLYEASTEHDEARFVVREIERLVESGEATYGQIAVFYRTNAQSRPIEEALVHASIPYKVVGGVRFYERKEIKDLLAYLRLLANPDDEQSLLRIANVPRRGIGASTLERLVRAARSRGVSVGRFLRELVADTHRHAARSLPDAAEVLASEGIRGKPADAVTSLGAVLLDLQERADAAESVEDLVSEVLDATGIRQEYESEGTPEALARLENLDEFLGVARRFDELWRATLSDVETVADEGEAVFQPVPGTSMLDVFLEQISLVSEADEVEEGGSRVQLMTAHNAKGLEFPVVFVVGMEEGIFPHLRSMENPEELEEERRLCYVAVSRASERLYMTWATERTLYGASMRNVASRFIDDLPDSTVEFRPFYAGSPPSSLAHRGGATAGPFRRVGASVGGIGEGDDVSHPKYGEGVVVEIRGSGEAAEAVVRFRDKKERRFLVAYAPLEKLGGSGEPRS